MNKSCRTIWSPGNRNQRKSTEWKERHELYQKNLMIK